MSYIKGFNHFKKIFFTPRVVVFILTGVGFMFFTFFTHDNAFELGISGIASIFIGIGVNNFTAIDTELREELKLQRKTRQAVKTLYQLQTKIKKIQNMDTFNAELIRIEMDEMFDYIDLCVQYMEDV